MNKMINNLLKMNRPTDCNRLPIQRIFILAKQIKRTDLADEKTSFFTKSK